MGSFIARHQTKLIAAVTLISVAGLLWMDDQRHGGPPEGKAAPTFELQLLGSDQKVSLASLKGEPVVLDFWATWCGPCRASLPHVNALSKRYAGKVKFFAVNAESEDPALQSETRDKLQLDMPIAVNGEQASSLYNIEMLPTTVVLDRTGKVARTFVGPASMDALASTLDHLL